MPRGGSTRRWRRRRPWILRRDGYVCQIPGADGEICGKPAPLTAIRDDYGVVLVPAGQVDHITPEVLGGTDSDANLRAACRHCNTSRGAALGNSMRLGTPSRAW